MVMKSELFNILVCRWTEFVTSSNIEQRVFPRTYAMAEVFWGTDDGRDNNNPNPAQVHNPINNCAVALIEC